jgi:two-component system sensor histidine kinase KdpD
VGVGGSLCPTPLEMTELLSAGIVVDTTVNIQHVESLNDVVAQITRIRVRETVPDTILDRADDIEVVDLIPDDLMQRLKEGKVYVPEQAQRALDHYCSPDKYVWYRPARRHATGGARAVDRALGSERHHRTSDDPVRSVS